MYNVEDDGVTHINVYSKGRTALGRFLSNFAFTPFVCSRGEFTSIEGLWYYAATGFQHEELRILFGAEAKTAGRKLARVELLPGEFKCIIKEGITCKLLAHPTQLNALIDSELPLAHYYVYVGKVVDAGHSWVIEYLEHIRALCKATGWRAFDE